MQYYELKKQLQDFPVFSIQDIEKVDFSFHKQRLSEWQEKGYIKKIGKGFYLFSDAAIDEPALFMIANRVYAPSYVSLEMALSVHGLIPEAVYGVTSVTSRKTRTAKTPVGNFIYRHVMPKLLFGYQLRGNKGHIYQIAEIEKAVLDYLYFHPQINDEASFRGMRFNANEFNRKADMPKFHAYLAAFENQALTRRANRFLTYINHA